MEFYNPVQKRSGAVRATSSPVPGMVNGQSNLAAQKVGNVDFQQIGTDQWGTGASFQGAGRTGSLEALTKGFSTANPEDFAGMDEMRDYYRGALSNLPGLQANNEQALDTQSQRGLSNLLRQHATANAGTGRLGSRQFAGEGGDITARAMSEYNSGLLNTRNNALDQAGKIGTGLSGIQNDALKERGFQMDQARSLSDLIMAQMSLDQGRQSDLMKTQAARDAANKQMWGTIIGASAGAAAKAGASGGE